MDQPGVAHDVAVLLLQLGVVVLAAKLGAEAAERLGQPPVLGELLVGVLIGPYALGGLALPVVGASLFGRSDGATGAISAGLYAFSQLGAVLLLFSIGLNTDLLRFIRYGHVAGLCAVGGNVLSFFLGAEAAVVIGIAPGLGDPRALLMGCLLATTSIGVSARVLADLGQLDTPEGATIVGGAVIDDVLGIVELGIVISLAATRELSLEQAAASGARAVVALAALTGTALVVTRLVAESPLRLRAEGGAVGLAVGCALVAAYAMEQAGLALILGSYAIGLALSQSPVGRGIERALVGLRHVLVPVFFVIMGAAVDLPRLGPALGLGLALCLAGILGKVVGCAVPALALRFRPLNALRVGVGMIPRGEVALIVAGVGLSSGVFGAEIFGLAIAVVIVTTLVSSTALSVLFRPRAAATAGPADARRSTLLLSPATAELFLDALEQTLQDAGLVEVARYRGLEGEEIAELRAPNGAYVSIALGPGEEGLRTMRIETAAEDWASLVTIAIDRAIGQVAADVLEPLLGEGDEARAHARRTLANLLESEREMGA